MELQNINEAHWREVFNKYDINKDGFIDLFELSRLLRSMTHECDIPDHVTKQIHRKADRDRNGRLDFPEFMEMIQHPDNLPIFGRIKKQYTRYINLVVPESQRHVRPKSEVEIDGQYEEEYSCCPPPILMLFITVVQIFLYSIDEALGHDSRNVTGPIATVLLYNPQRQKEAWRYISYMFVHVGVMHLVVNLLIQVLLGTALEMVHRYRVLYIYIAGVLAGSLGTSITDPAVKLAGASGGVYSLITAHVATIIMNWTEMSYPLVQMLIFIIVMAVDVGTAIYNRYVLDVNEHIGYAAHLSGAIAGLLVGIVVLRNLRKAKFEKYLKWAAIILYVLLMGVAIIINISYRSYYPKQVV